MSKTGQERLVTCEAFRLEGRTHERYLASVAVDVIDGKRSLLVVVDVQREKRMKVCYVP